MSEALNVEIKARSKNNSDYEKILLVDGADYKGVDHQIDTYFNAKDCRLKLREGNIENTLIRYEREDKAGPKTSKVNLYTPNKSSDLKEILISTLGKKVVVDKQRKIFFIKNIIRLNTEDSLSKSTTKDFILWNKDDCPSYQLVSLVDDIESEISLIIRGEDLLESTQAQLYLASQINKDVFTNIKFIHHPLLKSNNEKLSKSLNSNPIRSLNPKEVYKQFSKFFNYQQELDTLNQLLEQLPEKYLLF